MLIALGRAFVGCVALAAFCAAVDAQAAPRPATLVPELRIDAADADLSPVSWIAVGTDGTIAVGQSQDHLIRFFDARGAPLGTLGRDGAGPGEFRYLTIHGWLADTLWVSDVGIRRITLVSPARELGRTVRWPESVRSMVADSGPAPVFAGVIPWAVYPGGSVLALAALGERSPRPAWVGNGSATLVVRETFDGVLERVIARLPSSAGCNISGRIEGGGRWGVGVPFCAHPQWSIAKDGSAIAITEQIGTSGRTGSYRVTVLSSLGDTVFSRRYSYALRDLPARAADSARARLLAIVQRNGNPAAIQAVRTMRLPSTYPPLERVLVGRDGTTWLELSSPTADRQWRVLDRRGDPVATITVPRRVGIQVAELGTVWATDTDEDGLESIVRFRVSR